ncbi:exo-beta-1,3-glucanase [Clavulina sp. PMI_390]|nr:exo-beta-1,3-glucanase [Clavulina sp. PMI_390]
MVFFPTLVSLALVASAAVANASPQTGYAEQLKRHRHQRSTSTGKPTVEKRSARFPYGTTKVRGVNIGGWLVAEPFITPSLFDDTGNSAIVDEWTFGQYQSSSTALAALQNHWNTFITEQDFADIAAAGLNHVRIPIGFWAFDVSGGEPYVKANQYDLLKTAIGWAANHGLWVIVDLHGVPGSQNGYDNSGHRGTPTWQTSSSYITRTNNIIKTLSAEFSQSSYADVVVGIAPMNEPAGYYSSQLLSAAKQFWYDSYGNIRQNGNVMEVMHDAFQSLDYWDGIMPYSKGYTEVMMDTHHYEIFSNADVAMSYSQHISTACSRGAAIATWAANSNNLWTIVGEFVSTPYDCAKYLNGRGIGARYDGTYSGSTYIGSCTPYTGATSGFSSSYKTFMREFWEAQTIAFEGGNGWIYWTWKTESADEWSYKAGLAGGWIPQNPTNRLYPNICD